MEMVKELLDKLTGLDPLIWMLIAVILFGLAILVWAIGKLRESNSSDVDDDFPLPERNSSEEASDLQADSFNPPAVDSKESLASLASQLPKEPALPPTPPSPSPAIQPAPTTPPTPAPAPAQASIGQGVTPETIDKLLRMVGSVIQQVEILQKSLANSGVRLPPTAPPPPPPISPAPGASTPPKPPSL